MFANLILKAAFITTLLLLTATLVVIGVVRVGLRPLGRLEAAIQKRSPFDMRPIERQVPLEARGIVDRLNALFKQLTEAQEARDRLISNAAHQLRNPIAAIHSMAQATLAADNISKSKKRARQLVEETRRAVRLTNQMLSFERLRGVQPKLRKGDVNLAIVELSKRLAPIVLDSDIEFTLIPLEETAYAQFNVTFLDEAITNLVENAIQHGGSKLSEIIIEVKKDSKFVSISVENDGNLIEIDQIQNCFERFSQIGESAGAGLGLALVYEIAELHSGGIKVEAIPRTKFTFDLPH